MRTAALVFTLILACSAFAKLSDLQIEATRQMWSSWKSQFGAVYEDLEEDMYRFNVFLKNLLFIEEYNANPHSTATLGINKFANLTGAEFKALHMGSLMMDNDFLAEKDAENFELDDEASSFPDHFDWRDKNVVTEVQNQGQCGSCWAFSSVDSLNSLYMIDNDLTADNFDRFSVEQAAFCDTKSFGCQGGFPYTVFSYAAKNGLVTAKDYPYNLNDTTCHFNPKYTFKNITDGPIVKKAFKNPDAAKSAIMQNPIVVLIQANQQVFQFYTGGIIGPDSGCGSLVDHAVLAVGFSSKDGGYFLVKNSWGADWGINGYVQISSDANANNGAGVCGILTLLTYGKPYTN